jgi:hypothetical protein
VLLIEDLGVVAVRGGDPVGHMIESLTPHNMRFVFGIDLENQFPT